MTTEPCRIQLERADRWPVFKGLDLREVSVLSAECGSRPGEPLGIAAEASANTMLEAVRDLVSGEGWQVVLVGKSIPGSVTGRVSSYHAARLKCWEALETSGVVLPPGSRLEFEVQDSPGQFVGEILVDAKHLPVALEVTRTQFAVCLGLPSGIDRESTLRSLGHATTREELLRIAVSSISAGLFVLRSFGQFDDRSVSTDLFASEEIIGEIAID